MKLFPLLLAFAVSASAFATDDIDKTRLPNAINAYQPAIMPVCDFDESILYFDRKFHFENTAGTEDLDDIWSSQNIGTRAWSLPQNLASGINTDKSDVLLYLSPDGRTALISGSYSADGKQNQSFSIIHKQNGKWGNPQTLNIPGYRNDSPIYSATLSHDLQTLILALTKPEGRGGMDLYYSQHNSANNTWSEPKPININTPADELSPFLAMSDKTLFFASNRPGGLGGYDIYYCQREEDNWSKWSDPINLGSPINTDKDDNNIWLTAFGNQAYYVSYDEDTKRQGIYKINLPDEVSPGDYAFISGSAYNILRNMKTPISSELSVTCTNLKTNTSRKFKIYPGDARFVIPITEAGKYRISIDGNESAFTIADVEDIKSPKIYNYDILIRDIPQPPVEEDLVIKEEAPKQITLYYEYDNTKLTNSDIKQLQDFVKTQDKSSKFVINTYADSVGSDKYNKSLTDMRANEIRKILVSSGISIKNISINSFGRRMATNQDQMLNRKLELIIEN